VQNPRNALHLFWTAPVEHQIGRESASVRSLLHHAPHFPDTSVPDCSHSNQNIVLLVELGAIDIYILFVGAEVSTATQFTPVIRSPHHLSMRLQTFSSIKAPSASGFNSNQMYIFFVDAQWATWDPVWIPDEPNNHYKDRFLLLLGRILLLCICISFPHFHTTRDCGNRRIELQVHLSSLRNCDFSRQFNETTP